MLLLHLVKELAGCQFILPDGVGVIQVTIDRMASLRIELTIAACVLISVFIGGQVVGLYALRNAL